MGNIQIRFTDFVDGSAASRILEASDHAAEGLRRFRDIYAKNPAAVMQPEDEQVLLAAFCEVHDCITDHILERCFESSDYCRTLKDLGCDAMTKNQGMDWHELGDAKFESFETARKEEKLKENGSEFVAFLQFLLRAVKPVPSLFEQLQSFREL